MWTSLVFDRSDKPRISYQDMTNGKVKYAEWTGSSWNTSDIAVAGTDGGYTSLALDRSGFPRIGYYDATDHDLKYASWDGTAWNNQTVDNAGDVGQYTSLALDSSGNPRISYYGATDHDLKYAYWDGTVWNSQTVDNAGDVGQYTSLALDRSGNPRISYYGATDHDLKYAYWDGTVWNSQTVDNAGDVGQYTSLALDRSGNPRISYYDATDHDLKYAYWDGTVWNNQTVDNAGDVGEFSSLKLSTDGSPRIAYRDATNDDLKYAFEGMAPTAAFTAVPVASPVSTGAVNIWGNSAINSISITGVGGTGTVVTATKISSLPEDVPAIRSAPVYQYIEVTPERYTAVQSASISFGVPLSWLEGQHADPTSVALNRYHENSWATLPTSLDRTANGSAYYTAESPGFSIFAIVSIKGSTIGAGVVQAMAESLQHPLRKHGPTGHPARRCRSLQFLQPR